MILGIIYNPNESTYTPPILPEMQDSSELFELFRTGIPTYLIEIAVSLLPIILFFLAAQFLVLRLSKRKLFQIGMGLVYTYIGLVLFLTGANVGFMPAGHYLGQQLASYKYSAVVIPVAMVMAISLFAQSPPCTFSIVRSRRSQTAPSPPRPWASGFPSAYPSRSGSP